MEARVSVAPASQCPGFGPQKRKKKKSHEQSKKSAPSARGAKCFNGKKFSLFHLSSLASLDKRDGLASMNFVRPNGMAVQIGNALHLESKTTGKRKIKHLC